MLNSRDIIKKMVLHFPRWMDIRKRTAKSNGGNILVSIAEEFDDIQLAIDDYKKDFFIDGYDGREDDIVAFLYKVQVGAIDLALFTMVFPKLELTQDIKTFYEKDGYVYYEDGCLFFRTNDIENNFILNVGPAKIEYLLDEYNMTGVATKMHVWNVFDEFAAFVKLERHEGEKNSDLVRRIYKSRGSLPNSSEVGLKNAILNELSNIDANLSAEDITIERPTPENLRKYYKEFGTVLEKLAQFNKDIYRTKQWDIDLWNHDFKNVDYVSHAWDVAIDAYQDGVGFSDDLKVSITDINDTASATVSFFQESDDLIQAYVRDNSIRRDLEYLVYKYANTLKPINVKYKITASEAKDFTAEDIDVECLTRISGVEQRKAEDLIDQSSGALKDITVENTKLLEDGKYYQVLFTPLHDYGYMRINSCKIANSLDVETNVALISPGYIKNANNELVNENTKKYVSKKHEFSSSSNVANTQDGITIDNLSLGASLSLDLFGMNNQYIKVQYNSPTSPVRVGAGLTLSNCSLDDIGSIIGDSSQSSIGKPKYASIIMEATNIKFNVAGDFMLTVLINNKAWTKSPGQTSFDLGAWSLPELESQKGKPLSFEIKIHSTNDAIPIKISDLLYSCYEVTLQLKNGSIISTPLGDIIPRTQTNENTLNITMKTYTGYSPVINFVHVGSSLVGAKYYSGIISPSMGTERTVSVNTNCKMQLLEVDSEGTLIQLVNSDYQPYYSYTGTSDNAYLKINLSDYSRIISIQPDKGKIETIGTGSNTETYVRLKTGESVQSVLINGDRMENVKNNKLNDLLNVNPGTGDKVFASGLVNGIIVSKNNQETIVKITKALVSGQDYDSFRFVNVPAYLSCAFVVSEADNRIVIGDSYIGSFESAYLFPKDNETYIAFNETRILRQEERDIKIVDVFSPFLPENKLMVYLVESMDVTGINEVRFDKDPAANFMTLDKWTLGRKTLRIRNSIGVSSDTLDKDIINIQSKFELRNTIQLDRFVTTNSGRVIDLSEYIITAPDGMSVIMKSNTGAPINVEPDFYNTETIVVEDDGFNKLEYSNIDEMLYIGSTPWSPDPAGRNPISDSVYSVMKPEGIITWKDIQPGTTVYLFYSRKIPSALTFDDPMMLYRLIGYIIDAYKKIGEVTVNDRVDGDVVDFSNNADFLESDRVSILCEKPGFQAQFDQGVLTFKKTGQDNVIAVKTGYYYVDGDEYFCFADDTDDTINKTKYVKFYNTEKEFGTFVLNEKSNNFIKNSYMNIGGVANTFSINFENQKKVNGISNLNSITACDSFNHWVSFGMTVSIKAGYNGLGLMFTPTVQNGYAYIDITSYLLDNNLISMYATDGIVASIGKEKKYEVSGEEKYSLRLPESTAITIISSLSGIANQDIIEHSFAKEPETRYYLVIRGSGVIDDIIMGDNVYLPTVKDLHKKNINKLKLRVDEIVSSDYISRLYLDNDRFGKSDGSEIDASGTIVNGSSIDWGITKLQTIDDNAGWNKCILINADIQNNTVTALQDIAGTIETSPVYVGDANTVKNFIFKINDVEFSNMSGFVTKILACETYGGTYRVVKSSITSNVGYISGSSLRFPYVKLLITIPGGNIIKNIDMFSEYMSDDEWAPVEVPVTNGTFTSGVLDTFYTSNYKVKAISIESVSNINDIQVQIRGAKEGYDGDVWSSWKPIGISDSMTITNDVTFDGFRFFQAMVSLKGRNAHIKINHIDLEVI